MDPSSKCRNNAFDTPSMNWLPYLSCLFDACFTLMTTHFRSILISPACVCASEEIHTISLQSHSSLKSFDIHALPRSTLRFTLCTLFVSSCTRGPFKLFMVYSSRKRRLFHGERSYSDDPFNCLACFVVVCEPKRVLNLLASSRGDLLLGLSSLATKICIQKDACIVLM